MQLKTILCEFGQIFATGNALMQLEMILCKLGRICATRNALMQLKTILCEFWRICANRNALMQLETILCEFGQISVTGNALMLLESILCEFGQICATGNPFQWLTVGRNSILNFPAKIRTGMCRALLCGDWWWLITQPRPIWKKAPPGLQRPSHAGSGIPGVLYSPKLPVPHLGPDPRYPWGLVPPYDSIIKKG